MSATEDDLRSWLKDRNRKADSNVYRRDWRGKCQALMWQYCYEFGDAQRVYTTAFDAHGASKISSKRASEAPAGAFHYWDFFDGVTRFGHVGLELGGGRCLMATSRADDPWALNAGVVDVEDWTRSVGLEYFGWSLTNGRNTATFASARAAVAARAPIFHPREQSMYVCIWNGVHIFTFGKEFVKHETDFTHADWTMRITSSDDRLIGLDDSGLEAISASFGVPMTAVVMVLEGRGFTAEGGLGGGHVWSRELENANAIATGFTRNPADSDATVDDARQAASGNGIDIGVNALPENIRDIAADRSAEMNRRNSL